MGETVEMSKRSRCIRCLVTDLAGLSELGLVGWLVESLNKKLCGDEIQLAQYHKFCTLDDFRNADACSE